VADIRPGCKIAWADISTVSSSAGGGLSFDLNKTVVAGVRAPADYLGVCLVPGGGPKSNIVGKLFVIGSRVDECCWSAGFKEHCRTAQYTFATFTCTPPDRACGGLGEPPCVCPMVVAGPPPPCAPRPPAKCAARPCDPARFLGADTATQGDWASEYGKAGHVMFGLDQSIHIYGGNSSHLPDFVASVSIVAGGRQQSGLWPLISTATDRRALSYLQSSNYKGLGFVATADPAGNSSSFEIDIHEENKQRLRLLRSNWKAAAGPGLHAGPLLRGLRGRW
jgi:hypothetical protein